MHFVVSTSLRLHYTLTPSDLEKGSIAFDHIEAQKELVRETVA